MPKYNIIGILSASMFCGTVVAKSEEEALSKAVEGGSAFETNVSLCNECSNQVDIGDVYKFEAELVE